MTPPQAPAPPATNPHGWLNTETLETRLGSFEFKGGYPASDTAARLRDALLFNRAVEAYLVQMHGVSWYRVWKGVAEAEGGTPNQVVLWENLMDGATLLLTGNCETVYGLCALDLKRDGPVVIEAPAMLLGGISDLWQREIMGIGPTGRDKGKGGKFLLLPPDHDGDAPDGYMAAKSQTFSVVFGVRGFQAQGGGTAQAVSLEDDQDLPVVEGGQPAGQRLRQRLAQGDRYHLRGLRPVLRRSGLDDRARAARRDSVARALPARGDRHREEQAVCA